MIIFYVKKTKEIIGTIDGRIHDEHQLKKMFITSSGIPKKDIGKYVVPFKIKYKTVEEPITEMRVVDKKTMKVENVVVGKKKVKRGAGMKPDVPFAKLILDMESGKKSIYDYKIKLKDNKVVGFTKK